MRWPSDLVLKSGGPVAFDSRSGVSSLVVDLFWAFLGVLSVDRRLCGCGGWSIFRKGGCGSVWVLTTQFLCYKGVLLGVSSDDGCYGCRFFNGRLYKSLS